MKISASVHAENFLLTPMVHFFKNSFHRNLMRFLAFPAYQPDSNILVVILAFLTLYIQDC